METSIIDFCSSRGYNIKNDRFKSDILKNLYNKYQIDINYNNEVSFTNKDLNNLNKFNHYISVLTSGNKYFLYLTKIKNECYSILIDRKLAKNHKFPKMIIINFRFKEELYNNTLFETELIFSPD